MNEFFEDEHRHSYGERNEEHELRELIALGREMLKELRELVKSLQPKLVAIELRFGGNQMQGPVTLTPSAKSTKATVLGFDATGAPFTGTMPSVTYTADVATFASSTPDGANGDDIVGSADGTTNLAASLTTAEGLALSDTSQVITSGFTPPPQVLASIKLDFSQPA